MSITAIKGMNDIFPPEVEMWQFVEKNARSLFKNFGFREIRTPILEKTELFARSIGEDTDIVEKEMYTFQDRKGRPLTMRPEATASIVRAIIQHNLYNVPVLGKFFTIGPMFRHENPQKGRYREFYQIDGEVIGYEEPIVDADVMYWVCLFLEKLDIEGVELHINSLGCHACRKPYREKLKLYLEKYAEDLCSDCQRRIQRNPLRVFDCKVPGCREIVNGAPKVCDDLCGPCYKHFQKVCFYLEGLKCPFVIDHHLVRGLDYYNRTAFEVITDLLGAQNAVGGGGRYDNLFRELGGPKIPAMGFALGMERLILLLKQNYEAKIHPALSLFIITLGESAQDFGFSLTQNLRKEGYAVEVNYDKKSLKSLMRKANKLRVPAVLIIGENEIERGMAIYRNMHTKEQAEIPLDNLDLLRERLDHSRKRLQGKPA